MKVLVFGAYSHGDEGTIYEDVCVDGVHHATRVVVLFDSGDDHDLQGAGVMGYQDLRPCDRSCGVSTLPSHEQEMLESLIAEEVPPDPFERFPVDDVALCRQPRW